MDTFNAVEIAACIPGKAQMWLEKKQSYSQILAYQTFIWICFNKVKLDLLTLGFLLLLFIPVLRLNEIITPLGQ